MSSLGVNSQYKVRTDLAIEEQEVLSEELRLLEPNEKYSIIKKVIDPELRTMFVSPKDVDSVVKNLGNIIANAINIVLHHDLSQEEIRNLTY